MRRLEHQQVAFLADISVACDACMPDLRADIADHKRLNYHLYEALKKSVYKPAAFFKGILLPLAASGNCSLREATIFGSVLVKVSAARMFY